MIDDIDGDADQKRKRRRKGKIYLLNTFIFKVVKKQGLFAPKQQPLGQQQLGSNWEKVKNAVSMCCELA